jgi:hypothetical protein
MSMRVCNALAECRSCCLQFAFARRARVVFAALFVIFIPATSHGQNGLYLFLKMQKALGGRGRIEAVRYFEQCVRAETWDNEGKPYGTVYKRTRWLRPNVLRLDQVGPGNSYVLYFNGVAGWEILPDKGLVQLGGDELNYARAYLSGMDLNSWLADGDSRNIFAASSYNVITISTKDDDSSKTEITLNPQTFLPLKETVISISKGGRVVTKSRQFQEWETFQGIRFPRRIINFHGDKKLADMRLREIKLGGRTIAEDLATRPKGLSPEMSHCGE